MNLLGHICFNTHSLRERMITPYSPREDYFYNNTIERLHLTKKFSEDIHEASGYVFDFTTNFTHVIIDGCLDDNTINT